MNNKLKVNIFGRQYTLVSEKNNEDIFKIASLVNDEISNVEKDADNLSKIDMVIIACNNIAEKYYDQLSSASNEAELSQKIKEKEKEIARLNLQLEQRDVQIKSLEMTDVNSQSLQSKLDKTKKEYEEKLKEQMDINRELEGRFYELQLKIAELEEKNRG
ncbi:cell division protein ZapA [Peptostreptococcaceae bacterium AS15]|nr:cell division protein ZapA [Peptostreptococcaceae bacterium AS15]